MNRTPTRTTRLISRWKKRREILFFSDSSKTNYANVLLERFLSKVKGKLTLLIHYLSSISAYEQEANQLGAAAAAALPANGVAPFSLNRVPTPPTPAAVVATSITLVRTCGFF